MRQLFAEFPAKIFIIFSVLFCVACTPNVKTPGKAVASPVLARAHFVAADGAVLPVRSWIPEGKPVKAVIVVLHGFNDYSRFFEEPGKFLSNQGIACYAYDQRGFGNAPGRGTWPGMEVYVDDLKAFVDQARLRHAGVPVFVLGESMGGAVAIVALASDHPPAADGLILSSPAVWGRSTMPWYQRALLEILADTTPWMRLTGEGLKIMASDNIKMLNGLWRDPLVIKATRVDAMYGLVDLMDAALEKGPQLKIRTLVLYGERDEVIPREPVRRMLGKMPGPPQTKVAVYENGYHMLLRDLQAEKPWRDIASWVENNAAPLPSGADKRAMQGLAQRH